MSDKIPEPPPKPRLGPAVYKTEGGSNCACVAVLVVVGAFALVVFGIAVLVFACAVTK